MISDLDLSKGLEYIIHIKGIDIVLKWFKITCQCGHMRNRHILLDLDNIIKEPCSFYGCMCPSFNTFEDMIKEVTGI